MGLHPSVWIKFQRECSNLLYTYQDKSEELCNPVTQQPQFSLPQQHQQPYQFYPRATSTHPSPTNIMWQSPPQQWPTTVNQNVPVWGSQNSTFGQGQMAELQPMTTVIRGPSPAAVSTRSNSAKSGEPFSLSKIISDTIGLPDTSLENSAAEQSE